MLHISETMINKLVECVLMSPSDTTRIDLRNVENGIRLNGPGRLIWLNKISDSKHIHTDVIFRIQVHF